jgi:hypothetical protein
MSFTTATAGRAGFVRLGTGVGGQADGTIVTTSVPNGVITSGSYADPSWITSLSGSKLSGTVVATNGVVTTSSYADPSWITSLSASKIGGGSPTFTGLTVNQATSLNTTTIDNGELLLGLYDQLIETSNNEFSLASGASYAGTADTWTQNQPYLWSSRITQGQITQVAGNLVRVQYTNTNASSVTWQDALRIDTSANTIIPTTTVASSTSTGALRVAGGISTQEALWVGNQLVIDNSRRNAANNGNQYSPDAIVIKDYYGSGNNVFQVNNSGGGINFYTGNTSTSLYTYLGYSNLVLTTKYWGLEVPPNRAVSASNITQDAQYLTITSNAVTCNLATANKFRLPSNASNITVNFTNAQQNIGISSSWVQTWELIIEQGASAYRPTAATVNGIGVTLKYATGATPEPNKTNIITYTVLYNGTYTLYGIITAYA